MKNVLLVALLLISQLGFSQGLRVVSSERIPLASEGGSRQPIISPQGDYILVTRGDMKGLHKYDLATKEFTLLTEDEGAGLGAQISSDGSTIVYRSTSYKDKLRYTTLKSLDVKTKKTKELIKATRNLQGVALKRGTVLAVENEKIVTKKVADKKLKSSEVPAVPSIKDGQLYVTKDGKTTLVSPQGTKVSYLWPSVSPDGAKLLYTVGGGHAYVANVDGSSPVSLGVLRAPKWMGNDWVVGMVDQDNGEVLIASKIVAVKATGTDRTELTDEAEISLYPSASEDATKIVYNTGKGEVVLLNVEPAK